MALNPTALSSAIATGLGQSGPTSQTTAFANGIITALKAGIAVFGASASGNAISGVSASTMASLIQSAAPYPGSSSQLTGFCGAIATHIMTGTVTYTGPPPPATPPWILGGTIVGLSGSSLASLAQSMAGFPSVSSQLTGMCTAITTHIMANATVVSGVIS